MKNIIINGKNKRKQMKMNFINELNKKLNKNISLNK